MGSRIHCGACRLRYLRREQPESESERARGARQSCFVENTQRSTGKVVTPTTAPATGNRWDNAYVENYLGTRKRECILRLCIEQLQQYHQQTSGQHDILILQQSIRVTGAEGEENCEDLVCNARALMHNQTARQTNTLRRMPRARAGTGPSDTVAHDMHAGQSDQDRRSERSEQITEIDPSPVSHNLSFRHPTGRP